MTELADVLRAQTAGLSAEAERASLLMRRATARLAVLEAHARRCAELARQAQRGSDLERQMAASLLVQVAGEAA